MHKSHPIVVEVVVDAVDEPFECDDVGRGGGGGGGCGNGEVDVDGLEGVAEAEERPAFGGVVEPGDAGDCSGRRAAPTLLLPLLMAAK